MSNWDRLYKMPFASVYPAYVAKAERKGRTKAEVDEVIRWLTGHSQQELEEALADKRDFTAFFGQAPAMNPARYQVTGTICGDRVETIEEPLKRDIRILDKLIDELAKGRAMSAIPRLRERLRPIATPPPPSPTFHRADSAMEP